MALIISHITNELVHYQAFKDSIVGLYQLRIICEQFWEKLI